MGLKTMIWKRKVAEEITEKIEKKYQSRLEKQKALIKDSHELEMGLMESRFKDLKSKTTEEIKKLTDYFDSKFEEYENERQKDRKRISRKEKELDEKISLAEQSKGLADQVTSKYEKRLQDTKFKQAELLDDKEHLKRISSDIQSTRLQ
jgi:hypothetical protein